MVDSDDYGSSMTPQAAAPPVDVWETSPISAQELMVAALVAGGGLDRVAAIAAEHAEGPVGIFVPRPGTEGDDGTPAERYVAELVSGGEPELPDEVHEIALIVCAGELLGAAVLLDEGCPQATDYLRAAATASLTGIAMMNARDETARSLGVSFITELMARRDARVEDVLRRAGLLGRDLSDGLSALCVDTASDRATVLAATIEAHNPHALTGKVGDHLMALVPGRRETAMELSARLAADAVVGVSSHYGRAGDARTALEEARLLMEVGATGASGETFRLLFQVSEEQPERLRTFTAATIGPLLRHDAEHATELEKTLRAYLDHNCNMNLTARTTFTHRHTVSNRLTRVRELTGLDPQHAEDRELLGLALKAHRVAALRTAAGGTERHPD